MISLNVGDAAILLGEIKALRETFGPDVEITVSEQRPEVVRDLYPDIHFIPGLHPWRPVRRRGPRWRESFRRRRTSLAARLLKRFPTAARRLLTRAQRAYLKQVAASDIVISTGGTFFVEHYNFAAKADELIAAAALAKPTFLYTQSLGPFARPKNIALMRRVVSACTRVFLRDERSMRHLIDIGADPSKLEVHCDAAFALELAARPSPAPGRRRLAISVRAWSHAAAARAAGKADEASRSADDRYRRAVADAVRMLARSGTEVVFLSTCQGLSEFSDDSRFAQRIVDEFLAGEANVRVDSTFRTPMDVLTELATFDAAIATRMHFAILALAAGTPAVAIAYEFKSRELMRKIGHEDFVVDYQDVSADWLVTHATALLEGGSAMRAEIAMMVKRLREDAMRPAGRIAADLRERA